MFGRCLFHSWKHNTKLHVPSRSVAYSAEHSNTSIRTSHSTKTNLSHTSWFSDNCLTQITLMLAVYFFKEGQADLQAGMFRGGYQIWAVGSISGTQGLLILGHLNPELLTWTERGNYLQPDLHIQTTETKLITNSTTVKWNYPDLLTQCREKKNTDTQYHIHKTSQEKHSLILSVLDLWVINVI